MDPNNITTTFFSPNTTMTSQNYLKIAGETLAVLFFFGSFGIIAGIVITCDYFCRKSQSKRSSNISRVPKAPINEKQLILYNGSRFSENKTPEAKILISGPVRSKNRGSAKLNKILKMIFGLEDTKENLVPTNTKIISIKMDGFKHGARCHDFEPIDGVAPGSYYTYQMYGNHIIQVTRYVVGEKSYVAGFCIYNEWAEHLNPTDLKVKGVDINLKVITALMESPKYSGRVSLEKQIKKLGKQLTEVPATNHQRRLPTTFGNVRYCRDLKRGIMTDDESEAVYHQEWDPKSKSVKTWKCVICTGIEDGGEPPRYSVLSMV